MDASLVNPWGLAATPASPLWVADNGADVATLYVGGSTLAKVPLTVSIPDGAPTGQVFNPTTDFVVTSASGSGVAPFIFSSEAGRIVAWNPSADPITAGTSTAQIEFPAAATPSTAVYKGLAIATTLDGSRLYATDFHNGRVDVLDGQFKPVTTLAPGSFTDPALPSGYAPFGIQNIHGLIYVTYARQDAAKHDDVAGPGHGFVDVYTTDGFLVRRLATRGTLNSPWGMTLAPPLFGRFAGDLLVGNFGDGRISVFDSLSGAFLGQLRDEHGRRITIDGLWGLRVGTAASGGPNTVLFSAGPNGEANGLLGALNPAP
jgi:uncharacterized protein (TIGR03118 family)